MGPEEKKPGFSLAKDISPSFFWSVQGEKAVAEADQEEPTLQASGSRFVVCTFEARLFFRWQMLELTEPWHWHLPSGPTGSLFCGSVNVCPYARK